MIKKWFPPIILSIFLALTIASGGSLTHSLTLIYSNNLYGNIEPYG
jgi:hypothetical protein